MLRTNFKNNNLTCPNDYSVGRMSKSTIGFTLIEIVVVIGIMGLLTAIIYSSFDGSRQTSRDQKRVSDISAIQLSLEQYFNKNGVYPVTLDVLTTKPEGSQSAYISEIPKDPSTNKTYNDPSSTNSRYFPITRTNGSDKCVSYHLWTTFEKINPYLDSKKSFNSSALPPGLYKCAGTDPSVIGINADALSNPPAALIYDVMP